MESPEFRNNPENVNPYIKPPSIQTWYHTQLSWYRAGYVTKRLLAQIPL